MKIVSSIVTLVLVFWAAAAGPNLHKGTIRWYAGDKTVTILNMTKHGGGSGSHIIAPSGKTYILTNKHVCKLADKNGNLLIISSNDDSKKTYKRKVIKKYAKHDLCIVEPIFKGQPGLTLGSKLSIGQIVGVLGHPRLAPLSLFTGEMIANVDIELVSKIIRYPTPANVKNMKKIIEDILDALAIEGILADPTIFADEMAPKVPSKSKAPKKPAPPKFNPKTACPEGQRYMPASGKAAILYIGFCLSKLETNMYTAVTRLGSSGSPVLNFWGNIVGITFAVNSSVATESFMVPLKYVKDFLSDK